MSAQEGRLHTLEIDDGSGFVDLGELRDTTLNGENAELDSTVKGTSRSMSFIHGRFSGTIDGEFVWDEANAGQEDIEDAFINKTIGVDYRWRMDTGSGIREYTAEGLVTSFVRTAPNTDISTASFTIRITGDLTKSTQA